MRADPVFAALSSMEQALHRAESEAQVADRMGEDSLKAWLDDFITTTRVWLTHWRRAVRDANRREPVDG